MTATDATVPAISLTTLYGKGIFSTIAIRDGRPFVWEKHWRRLETNARRVGIDLSDFSEGATRKALDEIIEANKVVEGRARITFFDQFASGIWHFESEQKTNMLITTADPHEIPENFRITVSEHLVFSLSQLAGVKSCNYLDNLIAFQNARASGFDEAIRLNERGQVTSACIANVFWLTDSKLYTPSLKTGCLQGTTREFVLENVECLETETGSETLEKADAIYLTSAGIGIVPVKEFDGRNLDAGTHPIMELWLKG